MPNVTRSHRIGVCLLSPHPGILATLQRLLSAPGFKLQALRLKSASGYDLGEIRLPDASVYIVDASSTGPGTGSLIEGVRDRVSKARLLVVKETLEDDTLFPYLRLGAKGVVRYVDAQRDLARAVKVVAAGGYWVPRSHLSRFVDSILVGAKNAPSLGEPANLSRREREVLITILQGLSNKEIATRLEISERTVKFHVSNLLAKFGVQRRADLILKHYQVWPTAS